MKQLFEKQRTLEFYTSKSKQSKKFNKIHEILEKDLSYLERVAKDFRYGKEKKEVGAKGITVEQVVRIAIVKQVNQLSYDALYDQLHDNISYRNFCKIYNTDEIPEKSTLWDNIVKLSAESWEEINKVILNYAKEKKIEVGKKVRMDSTGVETNIHYPTDGTLLWDSVRVLSRIMECVQESYPEIKFEYMDHTRRAKRRNYKIINTRKDKVRKQAYRDLLKISQATGKYAVGCIKVLKELESQGEIEAGVYREELERYAELLEIVINQTTRRVLRGEKVESKDKVVSIFEPHTDILVKGGRDIIFGHKILLSGGKSNLILDCIIERNNWSDKEMFTPGLKRIKDIYSWVPEDLSLDGGFASEDNYKYAISEGVNNVLFTKTGVSKAVQLMRESRTYKRLLKFRAGIEGCISTVKRSYGLDRCTWRSWKGFKSYVWSSVVAFNLMTLAVILLQ